MQPDQESDRKQREAPAGLIRTAVLVMSHNTGPGVLVSLLLQTRLPKH